MTAAQGNLWTLTAGPLPQTAPLDGDLHVDLAVIGGGFTGLSAALHAAEAGLSVAVIEAEQVGFGKSIPIAPLLARRTRETWLSGIAAEYPPSKRGKDGVASIPKGANIKAPNSKSKNNEPARLALIAPFLTSSKATLCFCALISRLRCIKPPTAFEPSLNNIL